MEEKRLFLLDAYALIYRAYYALINSPRVNSRGENTSAVFGFCNTLDEVLRKWNPTHIAVCFDPKGPTFRHEAYPDYKANREAQPEDITLAVPYIKEIIAAYNIPIFEVPGYEADDVIGTISRLASERDFTTYMMTPDKDYGQLVSDNVLMFRPALRGNGFEIRGPREICEKFGIERPEQVIDLLALEGDAVDNIPGCPGVGPKTATKLIAEFGSVENMLAHVADIKGAVGRKIADNADKIEFSKMLATIRRDVPVEVNFDDLRRSPEDVDRLRGIYSRLEFKSFLSRLGAPLAPAAPAAPAEMGLFDYIEGEQEATPAGAQTEFVSASGADYAELTDLIEVGRMVEQACAAGAVGVQVYAVGAEAMNATLCGVALSLAPASGRYIPIPADKERRSALMALLEPLFTAPSTIIVSHDIKRDMVLLRREGIILSAPYFDTMLAHYVLQPEMKHRPADVAMSILSYRTLDYTDATSARKPYAAIPADDVVSRVCEQADLALRLRGVLADLLEKNSQRSLLEDVELPLARVLADMEWTGVRIDSGELAAMAARLTAKVEALEAQAYEIAGEKFNISSPMQVGEILFGKMQLDPKAKRTKKGSYSTTEEILEKHRADSPLVGLILDIRGLRKLLSTYVEALPAMVNPATGKIHTTFNQTVTATGRISSANPNLQNIPIRTDEGREVRRAFIADPGCSIFSADYSQIELRLLAALSHDPELTEAFREGLDIHRATAAKIYHLPYDEVTDTQRRNAKTANFGTVYGISAFGLSERLGIPRKEAKELIDGYFATYPHIREYIAQAIEGARRDGYVSTIMGRKRFLPDINSRNATVRNYAERNAVNAPLQGSAADIIKVAMIRIADEIAARGMKSRMVLQVHDELIFNVVPGELADLQEMVIRLMEGAFSGDVPLEVGAGTGANWLEAH